MQETYVQHMTFFKTKVKPCGTIKCMCMYVYVYIYCVCVCVPEYLQSAHTQMHTCMNGVHSNCTQFSAAASRLFKILG